MTALTNKRRLRPEKVAPYFFISPFYIIFTIFFLLPTIASFILAFYKWKGVKAPKPRGWGNFEYLFLKSLNSSTSTQLGLSKNFCLYFG